MMTNQTCSCDSLREREGFSGWADYQQFLKKLASESTFDRVLKQSSSMDVGLEEQWYRCVKCKTLWRLLEPDPPFKGLWERLN